MTSSGSTPEPIEAGCCLTSCGGSPAVMQSSDALQEDIAMVKTVVSDAKKDLG
ncbi:hypothetical protein HOD96_00880 [Candidatus Falkowbacteria bacterium]|nr:hypothetical protein [Candidatus Falkowbacteria bacterium]MBT4433187.1 hypothetical protein [Candidatus Falkowbacteria bacterium]